jgi:TonB family protein
MPIAQEKETRRLRPRWDSGKPRLALTLSGGIHAAALTGFLLYNALPTRPISAVPVFEMVSLEQPRLRPVAPKSPEPPSPPENIEARAPEAPKLTAKPKKTVPSLKREPKAARAEADTSKPVKDVASESSEFATTIVANVPSDPRLSFWAGRVKKLVERSWSPPAGIEIQGRVKSVVSFQVARNGSISAVGVTLSSGNVMLDQLAERTILRLEQVPPVPENFPGDVLQVSYEFIYQGQ